MNAKEIGKLIQDNKPELKLLDDGSYQLDFTITMKVIETALQQEAKALTVEQLEPCETCAQDQATCGRWVGGKVLKCANYKSAMPPESARIRELKKSLQFVNATLEARASDIARLYKQNDALESKIARAIEVLKKPHEFDQSALVNLFSDMKEVIEILGSKP